MKAVLEMGISDVFGIDGIELKEPEFLVASSQRAIIDLKAAWALGRRFEAALCLEVAEHLHKAHASRLIDCLAAHTDYVVFSAACPEQRGQHHVNCEWPAYWQALFNERHFVCDDGVRWRIWNDDRIEPWYRQNLFIARRDSASAGLEPRLRAVVHPGVWSQNNVSAIEKGTFPGAGTCRDLRSRSSISSCIASEQAKPGGKAHGPIAISLQPGAGFNFSHVDTVNRYRNYNKGQVE